MGSLEMPDKVGKEIADALGLKHVRKIAFHIEAGYLARVIAEFYPESDGVKQIPAILKKYRLVEEE